MPMPDTPNDARTLAAKLSGRFIVFDGPDGSGKSTQRGMMADYLTSGRGDVVSCRDPGGTEIGDRIRSVLLDFDLSKMDVNCETLLFMASRAQLVAEVVRPALNAGQIVLCDRFVTSTCAYQGAAGYNVERVIELARFAIGDFWPHLTVLFDVDVETGFKRIGRTAAHAGRNRAKSATGATLFEDALPDAMEARSIEFHRRVRRLFLEVGAVYPTEVVTVDGTGAPDVVHQRALECMARVPH